MGIGSATAAAVAVGLVLGGCTGESSAPAGAPRAGTPVADGGDPGVIDAPAPAGTERGRAVASRAGCLACHSLAGEGNDGPGPDLTHVGTRLHRAEIRHALRSPEAPMPSYAHLPAEEFRALVDYLVALR